MIDEEYVIICLCIFIPPLAVLMQDPGIPWFHLVLSLFLTMCFWLPGFIHALWFSFYRDPRIRRCWMGTTV